MPTSDKAKLEKLKVALEYAKRKPDNDLKVIRIKEDIKLVKIRIKEGK